MVQCVKVFATLCHQASQCELIPGSHVAEGENQPLEGDL